MGIKFDAATGMAALLSLYGYFQDDFFTRPIQGVAAKDETGQLVYRFLSHRGIVQVYPMVVGVIRVERQPHQAVFMFRMNR